jgi:hypothetical protein
MFHRKFSSLQRDLTRQLGRPVISKTDAVALETDIFKHTGKLVSYNTIRRFFGLAHGGEPRESVLNIYAEYLGYESYALYNMSQERHQFYNDWQTTIHKSNWTQEEREELIDRAIGEDRVAQSMVLSVFWNLYRSAPYEDWIPWFQCRAWHLNVDSFGLRLFYNNALSESLRRRVTNQAEAEELVQHDAIVQWSIHFFVDYSTLMDGFFHHISKAMYTRYGASIFTSGLMSVRHIWNNTWNEAIPYLKEVISIGYNPEHYPVLNSRYFSSLVYLEHHEQGRLSSTTILQIQQAFNHSEAPLHYLLALELFPTLALCGYAQEVIDLAQFNSGFGTERIHWSAALDLDLSRLALMLAHAQLGNFTDFSEYELQITPKNWYESYSRYQQALYSLAERRLGRSEFKYPDSLAYYPGIAAMP